MYMQDDADTLPYRYITSMLSGEFLYLACENVFGVRPQFTDFEDNRYSSKDRATLAIQSGTTLFRFKQATCSWDEGIIAKTPFSFFSMILW